VFLKHLEKPT